MEPVPFRGVCSRRRDNVQSLEPVPKKTARVVPPRTEVVNWRGGSAGALADGDRNYRRGTLVLSRTTNVIG